MVLFVMILLISYYGKLLVLYLIVFFNVVFTYTA